MRGAEPHWEDEELTPGEQLRANDIRGGSLDVQEAAFYRATGAPAIFLRHTNPLRGRQEQQRMERIVHEVASMITIVFSQGGKE